MSTILETIMVFALLAISLYLLFYLIGLYYKAYRLVKLNIGSGTAIIFAVSIVLLCCNRQTLQQSGENIKYNNTNFKDSASVMYKETAVEELEDNKMNALHLYINYAQPLHTKKMIPISAYCSFTGTSFNNEWKTTMVDIRPSPDSTQIYYSVAGDMDWSLLGVTFLYSSKHYDGMIEIDNVNTKGPAHSSLVWAIVVMMCAGFAWYYMRKEIKKEKNKQQ